MIEYNANNIMSAKIECLNDNNGYLCVQLYSHWASFSK